ncbi:MAG TPA: GIY-YIG nuclease family protein [Sulfuricurvum sp.]|nr:GIY-YIG nuclease family protein [Sulfuricurvum sp.]
MSVNPPYTLYILRCSDDTFYTGIALDVDKRVMEHNTTDKGAKYTRYRRPVTLIYQEYCVDKSTALKRELAIKKMNRQQKEALTI